MVYWTLGAGEMFPSETEHSVANFRVFAVDKRERRQFVAEREPGEYGAGNRTGEIAEQAYSLRFVSAIGKLREDESREPLRDPRQPELGEMAVEFADRFADVLYNENFTGQEDTGCRREPPAESD